MGLNLRALVQPATVDLHELRGETIAVDAYGMFYQFLTTLRDNRGRVLTDDHGNCISHIMGLVSKTEELLAAGVRPVYVLDGPPHPLKLRELDKRRAAKDVAKAKLADALAAGDVFAARKAASQTAEVTREMVESVRALLGSCGLPYVMAPQDGEAQCAAMAARGQVDAAASNDYDTLVYGAPRVLRNITSSKRATEEVLLASFQVHYGLSREQLVDLALLVGNDFHDGVKGVGPKTAVKLLAEHGTLPDFMIACAHGHKPANAAERKVHAAQAALEADDVGEIRELFLRPQVDEAPDLHLGNPDAAKIHERLVEVHGFSRGRADRFAETVVTHFEKWQARRATAATGVQQKLA